MIGMIGWLPPPRGKIGFRVLQQPPFPPPWPPPGRRAIMAPPPPPKPRPPPKPPPKPRASALPEERLATATVAAAARLRMSLRDMIVLRVGVQCLGPKRIPMPVGQRARRKVQRFFCRLGIPPVKGTGTWERAKRHD